MRRHEMDEIDGKLQVLAAEAEVLAAGYRVFRRDCIRWVLYKLRIELLSGIFVVCLCMFFVGISIGKWFFFPTWFYVVTGVSYMLGALGFIVGWRCPHIRTFDPHSEVEEIGRQLSKRKY